jgi:hypothetical protein
VGRLGGIPEIPLLPLRGASVDGMVCIYKNIKGWREGSRIKKKMRDCERQDMRDMDVSHEMNDREEWKSMEGEDILCRSQINWNKARNCKYIHTYISAGQ